ncbi:WlaTC/HtrL family glycosyltransferase [Megamonas hypermegale]|uniref:WlaTC/HtrL family glycosyltransferase n=1 Tax=Megamonas hypermegale TaxID=158847 RepID=UPI00195EFED6|nr:WlaTC/HtrL family glycosyltransferase [Megamonas hypermegale]MBM6761289.1 HtrL family protein [Megamonas hypermegale]
MKEISIVTWFFDIGRKDWKGFERDNTTYANYFKFWARLKNHLVIYTEPKMAEQVKKIRADYNLLDKTTIIVIEDVRTVDQYVYKLINTAISNKLAVKYRCHPWMPESCNPMYNYVTYLKAHLTADAINRGLINTETVAWIDFGFNHGGATYPKSEEFSTILTDKNLSKKIHIFAVDELDNTPIFEIVRNMHTYIAGAVTIAPTKLWQQLADLYRQAAISLGQCGFADDDQTLAVMAYRANPNLFEVHYIDNMYAALDIFQDIQWTKIATKQYKKTRIQAQKLLYKEKRYIAGLKLFFKYLWLKLQKK